MQKLNNYIFILQLTGRRCVQWLFLARVHFYTYYTSSAFALLTNTDIIEQHTTYTTFVLSLYYTGGVKLWSELSMFHQQSDIRLLCVVTIQVVSIVWKLIFTRIPKDQSFIHTSRSNFSSACFTVLKFTLLSAFLLKVL